MPRFLVERTHPPLTNEEWAAGAQQFKAIGEPLGLTWIKSYYSTKEGKCYCEFEAPTVEAVYEYLQRGQSVFDRVSPIDVVVDPAMFR